MAVVHAPVEEVRGHIGRWTEVLEDDERGCRVRMTVDSLAWPTMALGSLGADFDVLRPAELREHLRDCSRRFHRAATAKAIADAPGEAGS